MKKKVKSGCPYKEKYLENHSKCPYCTGDFSFDTMGIRKKKKKKTITFSNQQIISWDNPTPLRGILQEEYEDSLGNPTPIIPNRGLSSSFSSVPPRREFQATQPQQPVVHSNSLFGVQSSDYEQAVNQVRHSQSVTRTAEPLTPDQLRYLRSVGPLVSVRSLNSQEVLQSQISNYVLQLYRITGYCPSNAEVSLSIFCALYTELTGYTAYNTGHGLEDINLSFTYGPLCVRQHSLVPNNTIYLL